ncbi:MAG: hypothetical protein JO052_19835 [Bradyrhizobium sp.]|nr:hypothetical protein [Bradyrhizobium sp.]MBV9982700.1 hypothetical protein [Bradyrhizobium sp.]
MKEILIATITVIGLTAAAAAEPPVALVEELRGKVTGAEFMDYVTPGQVIKIGPGGAIILSYLKSCRRETISGIGTVIVGSDASKVHLSDVRDETIACDADHAHATVKETSEAAATIVRGLAAQPAPQVTLYGASPMFAAAGRGTLVLERLDEPGERQKIDIGGNQIKGRFFDFAKNNRQLAPGGTYLARFKETAIVFRIDPQAKGGATPLLGRLLQMD